jgi:SulP family sulfate permease
VWARHYETHRLPTADLAPGAYTALAWCEAFGVEFVGRRRLTRLAFGLHPPSRPWKPERTCRVASPAVPVDNEPPSTGASASSTSGWRAEFTGARLLSSVNAAVVLFLLEMIITLSVVALIYSGDLAVHLPTVVGAALIGNAILVVVVSLFGSFAGTMAVTQDTPAVILAGAAAAIAAAVSTEPERLLPTVAALLLGTTVVVGVVYVLLGVFRLGGFVRFLPFPVLGGFLAGTGWLLLTGGIGVATGGDVSWDVFDSSVVWRWMPAVLIGAGMVGVVRRTGRPELLAGMIPAIVAAFYAVMALGGRSPSRLADDGWLLGPFPDDVGWAFPVPPDTWSSIDGSAIVGALPAALPAVLLAVVGLLLNTTSLELLTRSDIDLDRELRVAGAANIASGLTGGLTGYHGMAVSTLNHGLARGRRLPGLVVAAMIVATVVLGPGLLSYIPRLLLGVLLAYVGLALLHEWLIASRSSFRTADHLIVVGIFALIVATDFVWGVAIGSVLTIVMFVVDYSRIDVVSHRLTANTARSRVMRAADEAEWLRGRGDEIGVYTLHGFIFFGRANTLLDELRARIGDTTKASLRFLVIDFRHVTGIDVTAALSFAKLLDVTEREGCELVITGLSPASWERLERGGVRDRSSAATGSVAHRFDDLDRGLEWCEEQLLASRPVQEAEPSGLRALIRDASELDALLRHLDRLEIGVGERLLVEGERSTELYLIESGSFTVGLERSGAGVMRLQTTHGSQILGELGFFFGTPRNATVVCDQPAVVHRLTVERWREITAEHPEVARTLDAAVIATLGERVAHLTRVVDALQNG